MVENSNILKKVKSAFFTHTILTKISLLFSRKEEVELDKCGKMVDHECYNRCNLYVHKEWLYK